MNKESRWPGCSSSSFKCVDARRVLLLLLLLLRQWQQHEKDRRPAA